jgi:hypothetical protein
LHCQLVPWEEAMTKQMLRIAAGVAALGILVGLAMPATSHAAPARRDATAAGDQPGPAGLWQSLVDLWDGLVSAVFAGSGEEGSGGSGGTGTGGLPDDGGNNAEGEGDGSPGHDPNG